MDSLSTVSLLTLCLDDLSIVETGVLKYPTIIVLLFTSFSSVRCCFICLGYTNVRYRDIYNCYILVMC